MESKRAWLAEFLDLEHDIPSHDTFRSVFGLIDADAFERCMEQVPSVGHVYGFGGSFGNPPRVFGGPIASDHLNSRMSLQPPTESIGCAVGEHVHGTMLLKVNQNRPPPAALAPRPVVAPEDPRCSHLRKRLPMEHPEKSIWTRGHPKQGREACARFRAHRKADVALRLRQSVGAPSIGLKQLGKRLAECDPRAVLARAAEPTDSQTKLDVLITDGQVDRGSRVVAVDATGGNGSKERIHPRLNSRCRETAYSTESAEEPPNRSSSTTSLSFRHAPGNLPTSRGCAHGKAVVDALSVSQPARSTKSVASATHFGRTWRAACHV